MFIFVYTLSECMSSNHIHWIGIIMVLHIILYNLISILLLVLAILCFILISVFLVGTYCIESPSFGCLCGYILSVFFFQFVSQWFRGVILYHCGHFAPHFCAICLSFLPSNITLQWLCIPLLVVLRFIYLLLWHFICSLWWITYVELLVFLSVLLLCVLCQSFALHDSQFVTRFDSGSFLGRILFLCGHIFRVCLQHRSIMDLCLLCLHLFMESHCVLYKSQFSCFESNFTNSVYKTEFWLFCLCLVALCVFVFVLPHILCHCSRCPFHCGQFLPLVGYLCHHVQLFII